LALLATLIGASTAGASKSQPTVIVDPARMNSWDPAQRTASLDESAALGVDIVKVMVDWRDFAPDSTSTVRPTGDFSNPNNYPNTAWERLDSVVAGAQSRGLRVWLNLAGPAPRWAVSKETGSFVGAYEPSADAFGEFVHAVGLRFPQVSIFSIWNEPNLMRFLQPQKRSGVIRSAVHYRELYEAAYSALRSSGHAHDTILFGELMPRSQAASDPNFSAPVAWLREFFCIDSRGHKLTGSTARRHGCNKFHAIRTSGLAYHPYRLSGSPLARETVSRDYAAINYMARLTRVLDAARRARHLTSSRLKIYNSEFGYQSDPPDPIGTAIKRIPAYLNISEYLNWSDPRVASYSQYLIVDDFSLGGFQTGLRFIDGTIKPGVYGAFQLPFLVMRTRSSNRVKVWGGLRAKPDGPQRVEIQTWDHGSGQWQTRATTTVTADSGYYERTVALRGASKLSWRAQWQGAASRTTKPIAPVRPRRD
jgi:hypothetical protein